MNIPKWWLVFALVMSISPAEAGDVAGRAKAYVERLKSEAQIAVADAKDRVRLAAEALQQAKASAQLARDAQDAAAVAVASEAVTEASYGVQDARRLLEKANALLAMREKQADLERDKHGKLRGMMLTLEGEVQVFDRQGKSVSDPLRPLQEGDRVMTGKDGTARLILAGGDADAVLEPGSAITIIEDSLDAFVADLQLGEAKVRARVQHWVKKFEVRTPTAVTSARGTEYFIHSFSNGIRVGVWEGKVIVTPSSVGAEGVELNVGEVREWTRIGGWGPMKPIGNSTQRIDWGD